MMAVQTPADLKLAQALAESQERLDQEDRKVAAARQGKVDLVLFDIEVIAKRIDTAVHRTIENVLGIGRDLKQVHQKFGGLGRDGQFKPWVQERFGFTVKTAYNYMNVFAVFKGQKCERLSHFSLEALYLLSSSGCSGQATTKALEMADRGERVTLRAAQSLVKDHVEVVEAVDDYGDDDHIDATNGAEDPGNVAAPDRSGARDPAGDVIDNSSADVVTALEDATDATTDDHVDRANGIELEQIQDAFDTYVKTLLDHARPDVCEQFYAWLRTEIKQPLEVAQ